MKKILAMVFALGILASCSPVKKEVQIDGLKAPAPAEAAASTEKEHGGCMGDPHAGDGCGCKHGHDHKGCGSAKAGSKSGCSCDECKKEKHSCGDKQGKKGHSCSCGKK